MSTTSYDARQKLNGSTRLSARGDREEREIYALLQLSARIGHEPLLVQASSGNTSVKLDGKLWIKASGKWLANAAREEILVPVDLSTCIDCLREGRAIAACGRNSDGKPLRPSIETLMHAILPQRVVVHVHSINTIAFAIRSDAQRQLSERLAGLPWTWIPYAGSGLPLAREIQNASSRNPAVDVFILGNHGLVVSGEDSHAAESLLLQVERRLATYPRVAPRPRFHQLAYVQGRTHWRLPELDALHALGTDPTSRRIAKAGILYPCQAIFLGRSLPVVPCSTPLSAIGSEMDGIPTSSPFLVLEGSGVLVRENITRAESAVLLGFVQTLERTAAAAPIRYLTDQELEDALAAGGHYKAAVTLSC